MMLRPVASTSRTVSAKSCGVAESYGTQSGSLPATSTAMMSAPSVAIRTAWARPCPRAAPVMNATLPASRPVIPLPSVGGSGLPLRGFDQPRADDQPLDLAGALIEPQQAHIAVDPLHRD